MKVYSFICVFLLITITGSFTSRAQDLPTASAHRKWYFPDHAVAQVAGNIGLLAVGPGYSLVHDKMNIDILYGLISGFEAKTSIHILTGKLSYLPWRIPVKEAYLWEPLKVGTGVSYSIGPQFYTTWPRRYPDGYYWWTTSFRFTPFIGSAISKAIRNEQSLVKRIQMYGEAGTHDLAITSFATNKAIGLWDIVNFAVGTKFIF